MHIINIHIVSNFDLFQQLGIRQLTCGISTTSTMEPARSEMSILPNGKGHDLGEEMFFNLGNAIMGSGILGLAYAMANTGILLFLFLLTAVAGLSCYSIHLLLKSSGVVGIRSYEQLGFRAFGMTGKMAAGIAITLQNIGAMSSYLYIVKSEFPLVLQAFLKADTNSGEWYLNGNYLVVLASLSVILPLALMKQLGYLGYASGFSLSCMVFFLSAVIYKKFQILCPFEEFSANSTLAHAHLNATTNHAHGYHNGHVMVDDSYCSPQMFTVNTHTAYTIPILAFAFVCHPEVLPIYTELRNPTQRKMQHISNISILIMYTMYFLAALFGYLTFYSMLAWYTHTHTLTHSQSQSARGLKYSWHVSGLAEHHDVRMMINSPVSQ
uniref:Solute carrier family 38 member 3 n=1 Tax=Sinocyclocheilus grahami TaxID=75366 RepID=A0A672SEV2_SINGR